MEKVGDWSGKLKCFHCLDGFDEKGDEVLSLYQIPFKKQFYNCKIIMAVIFTNNSISKGWKGS